MQNRRTIGNHKQQSMWQVPLQKAVYNHQQQLSSNKKKSRNIKIIWILLSISYKSFQHELLYRYILYKYILLVRDICEKYRLRGEANIPSCFSVEGHLTVLETGIFLQITLTNRIYLFNSAEYFTASKTVACKQVQNFRPPRSFDFQSTKTGKIFSKK